MLSFETFTSPAVPIVTDDRVPDGTTRHWSPITSTLVLGDHDAVLIDPPLTVLQARAVAEWVAESGRELKAVYSTHGHADHWFGTSTVLERFPRAAVFATPDAISTMRELGSPEARRTRWDPQFPGLIGDTTVHARPPAGGVIDLEGHPLVPIEVGHTDTDGTSVLFIPDLEVVAAGDVVYANLHLSLREGSREGFEHWLAALRSVQVLHPHAVICGHRDPAEDDDPVHIQETREYLHDALDLLDLPLDPLAFFSAMTERHPGRLNTGALWSSACALFPAAVEQEHHR